jgi:hypothetical protein
VRGFRRAPGVLEVRGKGRGRINRAERVSHTHLGMPFGECRAGHLEGLLRNDVRGRSVQRHRKPPVGGCDSIGYGTLHLIIHIGDARHGNSVDPRMASIRGLPATSGQEGNDSC